MLFLILWMHASHFSTEELNPTQAVRALLPLILESSTESVAEISSTSLERILGPAESDAFLARIYERLVTGCYNIIANHSDPSRYKSMAQLWSFHFIFNIKLHHTVQKSEGRTQHSAIFNILNNCLNLVFPFGFLLSGLDESVLEECLQYLEKQLENSQVRKAMEEFFSFRYELSL